RIANILRCWREDRDAHPKAVTRLFLLFTRVQTVGGFNVKKMLGIGMLLFVLILTACGEPPKEEDAEEEPQEDVSAEESEEEKTTEEIVEEVKERTKGEEKNAKDIKELAEEASIIKMNTGDYEKGTSLFIEGEVDHYREESDGIKYFTLGAEESDGYGLYGIEAFTGEEIKEGDKVRV